ncbi:hypothetical protein NDU88_005462 [Pleurodeles waltl]|uniref:Uncharacterized protein n=1 Tax=Pleurodeles waltl TaxID=8319 RepID=A0AAV7UI61_PLEWA|nr:hypothetical protein NDU88_005462 [Pleurodeles waltl]
MRGAHESIKKIMRHPHSWILEAVAGPLVSGPNGSWGCSRVSQWDGSCGALCRCGARAVLSTPREGLRHLSPVSQEVRRAFSVVRSSSNPEVVVADGGGDEGASRVLQWEEGGGGRAVLMWFSLSAGRLGLWRARGGALVLKGGEGREERGKRWKSPGSHLLR